MFNSKETKVKMSKICSKCGLPEELCVCQSIAKESQKIIVRMEKRKFGRKYTIIEGLDKTEIDIIQLTKRLKAELACGGTIKSNQIELQGDHQKSVKKILIAQGFAQETIEVQN